MANLQQLVDELSKLTVLEAAELVQHRRPVVEVVGILRVHHDGAAELRQAFLVAAGIAERAPEQADRLRDMHVHATWVAGQLVYAEA